jgi:hypothetical protein
MTDRQPWEKRPSETPKAFEAFGVYRDLGSGRSLIGAAKVLNKGRTIVGTWSQQHDWVQRAEEYDLWVDSERLKAIRTADLIEYKERLRSLPREQFKDFERLGELAEELGRIIEEQLEKIGPEARLTPTEIASLGRYQLNALELRHRFGQEAVGIKKLIAEFLDRQK